MRFKVIVCNKCGRARGARTASKRVTCNRCGAVIKVKEARAYLTTDSEQELAAGVAEINAELQLRKGGSREDIPDPVKIGTRKARGEDLEKLILDLGKEKDRFTLEDIQNKFKHDFGVDNSILDERNMIRILDVMKEKGLLMEFRDGAYRLV